jgi:hypothetical protein
LTPDLGVLELLRDAISSHDPARVAACFTHDYQADLRHHPERSCPGADQVRRNWTGMFTAFPDMATTVLRSATRGREIWSEWEMTSTGAPVALAGPVILSAWEGQIAWARFYLEHVDR